MEATARAPAAHPLARRAVVASLAALSFATRVAADPVPARVRLAWVRGADADACPDVRWMRAEVTRRMRRDPFADDGPRSIEAVVERAAVGWRATLRVRDNEGSLLGERTLTHDADRCDPIADAAALAIALAVDPDAVVEPAVAATPTAGAPAAPGAPTAAPTAPPRRPRAPRREPAARGLSVTVGALGGLSVGVSPSLAVTAGLVAAVEGAGVWSARVRLDVAPGAASGDGHFVYGFTRATALGCVAPWRTSWLALGVCAGVSGALLHTAVRGLRALDAGDQPWLATTASVGLRVSPSPRWFVALDLDASVALVRAQYLYAPDAGVIDTQPLGSGGGSLTVGLRVP